MVTRRFTELACCVDAAAKLVETKGEETHFARDADESLKRVRKKKEAKLFALPTDPEPLQLFEVAAGPVLKQGEISRGRCTGERPSRGASRRFP